MLRRFFMTALMAVPLAACLPSTTDQPTHPAEFVGRWVEVLLGGDGGGFELFADGRASSIDQPELIYTGWRTEPGVLFLTSSKTTGDTTWTLEAKYVATITDTTRLHLSKSGPQEWSSVFRMID